MTLKEIIKDRDELQELIYCKLYDFFQIAKQFDKFIPHPDNVIGIGQYYNKIHIRYKIDDYEDGELEYPIELVDNCDEKSIKEYYDNIRDI